MAVSIAALLHSNTAVAQRIDNSPAPEHLAALNYTRGWVNTHAAVLFGPFGINSGYRSQALNDYLRARDPDVSTTSWHMKGSAVDIRLDGMSPDEALRRLIDSGVPFDRAIIYDNKGHMHLTLRANSARRQARKSIRGRIGSYTPPRFIPAAGPATIAPTAPAQPTYTPPVAAPQVQIKVPTVFQQALPQAVRKVSPVIPILAGAGLLLVIGVALASRKSRR